MQPAHIANTSNDFTIDRYRLLCKYASDYGKWISFNDFSVDSKEPFVLWRHDVDASLNRALCLARIEHNLSLKSTYFLNIHSEFYNLAERSQSNIVHSILDCGHYLGVHFDASYYGRLNRVEFEKKLQAESDYLYHIFGIQPAAFSFHNPDLIAYPFTEHSYCGMTNAYSSLISDNVKYCSDSNGYWRYENLIDVLAAPKGRSLHVLTHPAWWQDVRLAPRQRIYRCAQGRLNNTLAEYDRSLALANRTNSFGSDYPLEQIAIFCPEDFPLLDYLWHCNKYSLLSRQILSLILNRLDQLISIRCGDRKPPVDLYQYMATFQEIYQVSLYELFEPGFMDVLIYADSGVISNHISGSDEACRDLSVRMATYLDVLYRRIGADRE